MPRYLVMGGAGSLEVAPGMPLLGTAEFPKEYLAEAMRGGAFLDYLRGLKDMDWTFLSPSALFFVGPRKRVFRLGGDQLIVDGEGNSSISYADDAIALADEIEVPRHSRGRFTMGY